MSAQPGVQAFAQEWMAYLEERGHAIHWPPEGHFTICSRNGEGRRYRWLLMHSERPRRRLTPIEHETLRREHELAEMASGAAYLVIKFERPEPKVLVLPAGKAARMGWLTPEKGGIPWDA